MDYPTTLASFDALVAEGIIIHSPYSLEEIVDTDFKVDFIVTQTLVPKSELEKTAQACDGDTTEVHPRRFGPGSDIYFDDDRMLLLTVNGSHWLVFNKFPVFRPQFMLLTLDSHRRQAQSLDADDLLATSQTLKSLDGISQSFYAFFNCGKAAGQSRNHKHIQIVPKYRPLFPDYTGNEKTMVPFKYFLHYFERERQVVPESELHDIYVRLLGKARASLDLSPEAAHCPHNMIMTVYWIMVVPRRLDVDLKIWGIPNAPGMLGMVFLPDSALIEGWKKLGPSKVYKRCGVPNDVMRRR